jgi:hypothetical protein
VPGRRNPRESLPMLPLSTIFSVRPGVICSLAALASRNRYLTARLKHYLRFALNDSFGQCFMFLG